MNSNTIRAELTFMNDYEWFEEVCTLLSIKDEWIIKDLNEIVGNEYKPIRKNSRKIVVTPFDERFKRVYIESVMPIETINDIARSIRFYGDPFQINLEQVKSKFPKFIFKYAMSEQNQIFFYPLSDAYKFVGFSAWINKDVNIFDKNSTIMVNNIVFHLKGDYVQENDHHIFFRLRGYCI